MKKFYRILVLVLSLAMIFSAFAVTASAAATELTFTVDLTKTLVPAEIEEDAEGNVYFPTVPNTSFEFVLTPGAAEPAAGVYAGVAVTNNTASVTVTNESTFSKGDEIYYIAEEAKINAIGTFTTPGAYHYVLSETASSIDHVVHDETIYDIYVYVGSSANGLEILSVSSYNSEDKKTPPAFENLLGTGRTNITKTVTGNMGDKEKEFTFTLKTTANKLYSAGAKYYVRIGDTIETATVGTDFTFTLSHGDAANILLMPIGVEYSVEEADYSELGNGEGGYTTTVNGNASNIYEGKFGYTDDSVDFVNDKNYTTTGVFMSYGPYIAVIVVAVLAIALFALSKKRKASEA